MANSSQNLTAHLFHLEQQLLQPSVRRDPTALTSLLAEDFREFGSSGRIYTRHQIIDTLAAESPRTITLSDPLCQQLAEDIALLTYRSTRPSPSMPPPMRFAAPCGSTATTGGRCSSTRGPPI